MNERTSLPGALGGAGIAAEGSKSMLSNRWLVLGVLLLIRTAMAFQFQSIAALGPNLIPYFEIDYASLGTLIGFYMLPGAVVALPGGLLGQRFGDKQIVVLALILMILGGVWIAWGGSYQHAVAGRLLSGIGGVLLNIILAKMVADWFAAREIVTAIALFLSGWPIGIGLALALLPLLAEAATIPLALATTALFSVLGLALALTCYRQPPHYVAPPATFRFELSRAEWLLSSLAGLVWTLFNVRFILILAFGPSFLTSNGYSASVAGATVSLVTWTILFSLPLGGYLAERVNSPDRVMAGCFLALAAILCAVTVGLPPALAFAALGLISGPPAGLIMKLPTEVLTPENRSAGMGVYYACYYAGMAVLVPIAGLLRDRTENPSAPLLFAAGLLIGAAVSLGVFRTLQARAPTLLARADEVIE